MHGDEFAHLIKQAAQQQAQERRPFAFGHIASYDPATGRCRAIIPNLMGEDGTPVLTPWMKLGTSFSGTGYGLQVAPMGGASFDNPTQGEQILVCIVDGESGTALAGVMLFSDTDQPPFPDMQPGEAALQAAAGNFVYLDEDGGIEVNTEAMNGAILVKSGTGDVTIDTTGNVIVESAALCDLRAPTKVTGDLTTTGNLLLGGSIQSETGGDYGGSIATTGDVIANKGVSQVSLANHTTNGVTTGSDVSGPPTPGT